MPTVSVPANEYKTALLKGEVNFDSDTFKAILLKSLFDFDIDRHSFFKNIQCVHTGSSNITFTAATKKITITDSVGSFVTTGIVVGTEIVITSTTNNNKTVTVASVSGLEIVTNESLTDESNTSAVLTVDNELASGFGYTQGGLVVSFTVSKDDTTNKGKAVALAVVEWTAAGGSIGPTPAVLLYDDTHANDLIIGIWDFGLELTAQTGELLSLSNLKLP